MQCKYVRDPEFLRTSKELLGDKFKFFESFPYIVVRDVFIIIRTEKENLRTGDLGKWTIVDDEIAFIQGYLTSNHSRERGTNGRGNYLVLFTESENVRTIRYVGVTHYDFFTERESTIYVHTDGSNSDSIFNENLRPETINRQSSVFTVTRYAESYERELMMDLLKNSEVGKSLFYQFREEDIELLRDQEAERKKARQFLAKFIGTICLIGFVAYFLLHH